MQSARQPAQQLQPWRGQVISISISIPVPSRPTQASLCPSAHVTPAPVHSKDGTGWIPQEVAQGSGTVGSRWLIWPRLRQAEWEREMQILNTSPVSSSGLEGGQAINPPSLSARLYTGLFGPCLGTRPGISVSGYIAVRERNYQKPRRSSLRRRRLPRCLPAPSPTAIGHSRGWLSLVAGLVVR